MPELYRNQIERLFRRVEADRQYHERLVARFAARGFAEGDAVYAASRDALQALRRLSLTLNDARTSSAAIPFKVTAAKWPALTPGRRMIRLSGELPL